MKKTITIFALTLYVFIGFSQNSDYPKLDKYFKILEENDRYFGSVAVTRNGEILYKNAIGYADVETQVQNTTETKFRIGSITKTFTAVLLMKAVDLDKVSVDQTIYKFFPTIENSKDITIRHLLNHRSGINNFTDKNFFSWYTEPITPSALLDSIVNKGVDFEPNEDFAYSNSNYVLLTWILEDLFDMPYPQILEKYITKPLNMTNTSYGSRINPLQNDARSYRMESDWIVRPEGDMSIPLGAGGVVSTPSDLCHFLRSLFNGKLISNESLQLMQTMEGEDYGFALYPMSINELEGLGHGGNIDAFSASLTYFSEEDLCFAITTNGSNFGEHDIAKAVVNEILGKPYELPTFEIVEVRSEELDQYLGTYECEDLPMDMKFEKDGNLLILEVTGQTPAVLEPKGNHKFSVSKYGVNITMIPSENKMHFEQNGAEFDFTLKPESDKTENANKVQLNQYLGTYSCDELPMDLTISKNGDTLTGQGTGQPSFPLEAKEEHVFVNSAIGLEITFNPKEKKMSFMQSGAEFEMSIK